MYAVNTTRRMKIILLMVIIGICIGMTGILYFSEGHIIKNSINDYNEYENVSSEDGILLSYIDKIGFKTTGIKNLEITGWIFEDGSSINTYNCHVALEDRQHNVVYILPTIMTRRDDVAERYGNLGVADSGFFSKANVSKLPLDFNQLRVIIVYENNESKMYYDTGIRINDGAIS